MQCWIVYSKRTGRYIGQTSDIDTALAYFEQGYRVEEAR